MTSTEPTAARPNCLERLARKTLSRLGAMPCASCPYKAAAKGLVRRTLTLAFRQGTRRVFSFLTLRTPHLKRFVGGKESSAPCSC